MNAVTELAAIGAICVVAAGGTWLLNGPAEKPEVFQCDPAQLREDEICLADVKGNVLWVDARPRKEWEESRREGAILWNLDPKEDAMAFEAEAAMRIVAAELVVVYCGSEACGTSRQIADRIRVLNLGPPVRILHGGWDALRDSSSSP